MNVRGVSKKISYIIVGILCFLIFVFYQITTSAEDPYANMLTIKDTKITSIKTGTANFDEYDGLNYNDENSYTIDTNYIAGNDSNENNRIVRSFDSITYNFSFTIKGKNSEEYYEDRIVEIETILSDEEKKYAAAESNLKTSISNVNTYEEYTASITIYITGAPNGFKIDPKFVIKESTDIESKVYLGKVDEVHNYEYIDGKYNNVSSVEIFKNYMPTIVSSQSNSLNVYVKPSLENPNATYNGKNGRYMNFVIGLELIGNSNKGIKGTTIPEGDISFDFNIDENSIFEPKWARVYSTENIDDISSVKMPSPYGIKVNLENSIYSNNSGTISINENPDGSYKAIISGYQINSIKFPTKNADDSNILNSNGVFGSYSITLFSNRTNELAKNVIGTQISIVGLDGKNTSINGLGGQALTDININDNVAVNNNSYYETNDYALTGEFVEFDNIDTKISKDGNGKGSVSKGTKVAYKSTFYYKKASSDSGVKQIIKVDTDAFKVVNINKNEDIKLLLECDGKACKNIKEDDFEISFLTGDFTSNNYNIDNNSSNTLNVRLLEEDKETIINKCSNIKDLSSYNKNQIMNLYGGPCIKVNENIEHTYKNISDAVDEKNNEIPITKIVIQTKRGIKLPNDIKIKVVVGLKVRNVSDITKTYPITTMAMTSDYDEKIMYYSPRVINDENSVTSPNNYIKSIYNGSNLISVSANTWGDSLKIVNYIARNTISVLNTDTKDKIKTSYNTLDNDTIKYKVKTTIEDYSEDSNADDVWWIKSLNVTITLPNTLEYIEDKKIGTPIIINNDDGSTSLIYVLPYTKPNMKIEDIRFNAKLIPNIVGLKNLVEVKSTVSAVNANNEVDTSIIGSTTSSYKIYADGIDNVVLLQKNDDLGTTIEKNTEFSYLLSAYNNTNEDTKLSIIDVLPYNGDNNGSKFSGNYKTKIILPSSQQNVKVYCSTKKSSELITQVDDKNNDFEECNITSEFVDVTAIKIEGISISKQSYIDDIKLIIKPENNKYSDKYNNVFYGKSNLENDKGKQTKSNQMDVRVINRNISGRVFLDINSDGIEDLDDKYLKNISVILYKLNDNNEMSEVGSTTTNEKGEYKFSNLDTGKYKVQLKYDVAKYDLTLRYAIEDTKYDSDAYKVSDDGIAEISNKSISNILTGIEFTNDTESITDMNMGLIPRYTFGFEMKKYITKIELNSNNVLSTLNYNNQSKVSLSVKNSANTTARIYYGITITNNSTQAGYVKMVQESIPNGLIFNSNDDYNKQWIELSGNVYSMTYENEVIKPGESKTLQLVLDMPRRREASTFLNTTSIVEMQPYNDKNVNDTAINENEYVNDEQYYKGEKINYAGISWHVINVDGDILTLLADSIDTTMSHKQTGYYKWSKSDINSFINNEWYLDTSLNLPTLFDNQICDDASGLSNYGGTLKIENKCQSEIYNTYKIRLLTETEYNMLMSDNFTDKSWLSGNYWLMNSSYVVPKYDEYHNQTNSISNKARAVIGTNLQDKEITQKLQVRPVITISSNNIIID